MSEMKKRAQCAGKNRTRKSYLSPPHTHTPPPPTHFSASSRGGEALLPFQSVSPALGPRISPFAWLQKKKKTHLASSLSCSCSRWTFSGAHLADQTSPEGPGFSPAAAAAEATSDARKVRQAPAGREGGSSSSSPSSCSPSGFSLFESPPSPSALLPRFSAKGTTACALFSGAGAPSLIVERGLAARRAGKAAAREAGEARRVSGIFERSQLNCGRFQSSLSLSLVTPLEEEGEEGEEKQNKKQESE